MGMEQAITERSIKGLLRGADFHRNPELQNDTYLSFYIAETLSYAQSPNNLPISIVKSSRQINKKEKEIFSSSCFFETLLLRSISKNLKSVAPKGKDRKHLTREVKENLKWGPQRLILKLDISSFYQSFNNEFVRRTVEREHRLSIQTRTLLMRYLDYHWESGHCGLPQGLEFSNSLSELCMVKFDDKITNHPDCLYYCRFVDDILIVLSTKHSQREKMYRELKLLLASDLTFNGDKLLLVEIPKKFGNPNVSFDYLGYKHIITGNPDSKLPITEGLEKSQHDVFYRKTETRLSSSKSKRIKNKIYKSFHSYVKNDDIKLLYDRLDYLTSNRTSGKSRKKKLSGLYYDNSELTHLDDLKALDKFLIKMINGGLGTLSGKVKLTKRQKNKLSNKSFCRRFKSKFFRRFSHYRKAEVLEIWRSDR